MLNILGKDQLLFLKKNGFIHIPDFYGKETTENLKKESELFINDHYNIENIEKHSAYPSDSSDSRESFAFMISKKGKNLLPFLKLKKEKYLEQYLNDFQNLISEIEGKRCYVDRSMLNIQKYYGSNKPVSSHFDGEFINFEKSDFNHLKINEAILPKYVTLVTVENENKGNVQGTVLRNIDTKEEFCPRSAPGDLLIFNNLRFRHFVPKLEKPRFLIGLRCFDELSYHFALSKEFFLENASYKKIAEGHITRDFSPTKLLKKFLIKGWPEVLKSLIREGAVF
jgi:hypothetical protein